MSRGFRYRRVLRVRELEEELAREEFLASERVARQAEEQAARMQAELKRAQTELTETRLHRRVPPEELLTAQTTLESLGRSVSEQMRLARDLRGEAEGQRAAWEGARADVRTLERLEERQAGAAREEQRRAEARALDEAARRGARDPQARLDPPGPGSSAAGDSGLWDPPAPPPSRHPRPGVDD